MSEGIIKSGRKQSFTVLYKSAIEDKRLPLDARGLLAIMVGLPEGWQYSVKGLAAYVGVSKDTIRRLLGKLEDVSSANRPMTPTDTSPATSMCCWMKHHRCREIPTTVNHRCRKNPMTVKTDNGKNRHRVFRPK